MPIDSINIPDTPTQYLGELLGNQLFVKRDDLIPFSFGGNKARKAILFFKEIDKGGFDCVVTYGSSSSNHCRVVANMAASRHIPCVIISPLEASEQTFNSQLVEMMGAQRKVVPVSDVHDTIERELDAIRKAGRLPYFIMGGGHGVTGTQAYVDCYEEIRHFENDNGVFFDYIFHASGTGTTQAGLVCGQLMSKQARQIIGISIARTCPRGRQVVLDSVHEYLENQGKASIQDSTIDGATHFIDDYTGTGYGGDAPNLKESIFRAMEVYGIPLDHTYTGKAFAGMTDYIRKNKIQNKTLLFIHTGGTPLFFDFLKKLN